MAEMDYYDNLDLKYPEIAICIDRIDRTNPGELRFYVPILTPDMQMDINNPIDTKIRQNSGNLVNKMNKPEVGNIDLSNYIKIKLPRELCALFHGTWHWESIPEGKIEAEIDYWSDQKGHIAGHGVVGPPLPHSVLNATVTAQHEEGYEESIGHYKGIVKMMPTDYYRYIPPGSKWVVVFIGGDINKPCIIAPYEQPSYNTKAGYVYK